MPAKRTPNYGPGSISTTAKARLAKLQSESKPKTSLLNALSGDAAQIRNRVETEKAMKKEIGGKR